MCGAEQSNPAGLADRAAGSCESSRFGFALGLGADGAGEGEGEAEGEDALFHLFLLLSGHCCLRFMSEQEPSFCPVAVKPRVALSSVVPIQWCGPTLSPLPQALPSLHRDRS